MEDPRTIFVFDIDGVLFPYEAGIYSFGLNEAEWVNMMKSRNVYAEFRPFKTMQKFMKEHNNKYYVCSRVCCEEEILQKREALVKHYPLIPEKNMYFVESNLVKKDILHRIRLENPRLDTKYICMVDDTTEVLLDIMNNTKYSTIHVSSFIE